MSSMPTSSHEMRDLVPMRRASYLVMLAGMVILGGLAASTELAPVASVVVFYPAYVSWLVCDLRMRRVAGLGFCILLLVALIPFWGLLVYMVITRRLLGVVIWLAVIASFWVPAALGALVGRGVFCVATGSTW
jgi:hypothetical protein